MEVNFYGKILEFTNGEKSHELNDCSNIQELIEKLASFYGEKFKQFLIGENTCFFLVNGKGIMMTGGLETKLTSGDKVEVLPFADAG
ncbi:MAG: MoaD/ThiS family protein [Treponema sp.]|nr:MoaD/ThiS family protein [Treponema sp.]